MRALNSKINIHEFFVEGRDADSSQVILHITEPANEEEYRRGYLFMVAEANQATVKTVDTINKWIEELETGFYDEELRGRDIGSHFEKLLERINKRSSTLLRAMQIEEEEIHIILGYVNEEDLCFAMRGDPIGCVAYQDKHGSYKTIDIVEENREQDNDSQMFSNIVSGGIGENDRVLYCSPHVDDGFSKKQIEQILANKLPKKSIKHFQNILEDVDNGFSFGGILIERLKHDYDNEELVSSKNKSDGKKPHESLTEFLKTQQDTEEILAPSLFGKLKSRFEEKAGKKSSREHEDDNRENNHDEKPKQTDRRKQVKGILHTSARHGTKYGLLGANLIWRGIKWTAIACVTVLQTLYFLITNQGDRRKEFTDHWKKITTDNYERARKWFEKLSTISKIAFIVGLVLIVIFIISIGVLKHRKTTQIKEAAYQAQITSIESKLSAAESNLIFNEEDHAREMIMDVVEKLNALPTKSREQKNTTERLTKKVDEMREKLRHAEHPGVTILLDAVDQGLNEANNLIVSTGLVVVSDDLKKLVALERGTQVTKFEENIESSSSGFSDAKYIGVATDEDHIFFVGNENAVQWKYAGEDKLMQVDIPGGGLIKDLVVYNDRLYSLVPEQNQIFKHGRHQEGFDSGTTWIKGAIDLSEAVSVSIDGLAWVLMGNGDVKSFSRGELQEFKLSSADPVLESPTSVWTKFESDWLYVFDPLNKRVVVFEKETGKLKVQYLFDNSENLLDFAIDEVKGQGFILDGTQVKQFVLGHLEE